MEQWQKEFLHQHEGKEIEINEWQFKIQTKRGEVISSVNRKIKLGILYVSFAKNKTHIVITPESVDITMDYWEKFAKKGNYQMIIVDPYAVSWKKEQFHGLGYHVLPNSLRETVSKGRFYKQLAKRSQKQITKKFRNIINAFEERKEKETFFAYELNDKISLSNITIYYKGYSGSISTKYENGYLSFLFEEDVYELKKEEDIEIAIISILKKAERKMRIKNTFQTPREMFDRKIISLGYKKEIVDTIFHTLLETYSWEEMEHYFYHLPQKELTAKVTNKFSSPIVHEIMNHFFIFENEKVLFQTNIKAEALETFKEMKAKRASEEAEEKFKNIFG